MAGHLLAADAYGSGTDTEFAHVVKDVVGVRCETRYRRWFDADFSEIGFLVGIGVAIR